MNNEYFIPCKNKKYSLIKSTMNFLKSDSEISKLIFCCVVVDFYIGFRI